MIGDRIRQAREQAGLTQKELAAAVGVAFQSVQQWEHGKTFPRLTRFTQLAKVLNQNPAWLQSGLQEPAPEKSEIPLDTNQWQRCIETSYRQSLHQFIQLGWLTKREDVSIEAILDMFRVELMKTMDEAINKASKT